MKNINEYITEQISINEGYSSDEILYTLACANIDLSTAQNREDFVRDGGVPILARLVAKCVGDCVSAEDKPELNKAVTRHTVNSAEVSRITGFKKWYLYNLWGYVEVREIDDKVSASDLKKLADVIEEYNKKVPNPSSDGLLVKNF